MQISDMIIRSLVEAVRGAARAEILPRFRNLSAGDVATKSGPQDLVTEADRAAEERLTLAIRELLPGALILGEEAAEADPDLLHALAGSDLAVIIDPVDGTWNFAHGLATFGVILAVMAGGQTVFGLLYDPVLDDWVMARRGQGAWFQAPGQAPRRLGGPGARARGDMKVFLPLDLYPEAARPALASRAEGYGRTLSLRCSCHEYRMMATGHADLMIAPVVKPWDHAAGTLVVEECGGLVLSGGAPGYDPSAPALPLVVCGHPSARAEAEAWQDARRD